MGATHDNFVTMNVFAAPLPPAVVQFGRILLIDDGSSLDGAAYKVYDDRQEAVDDNDANELSDHGLAAVEAALVEGASDIAVASMDSSGGDDYVGVLQDIRDSDLDYMIVCIDSREAADIVAVSGEVETHVLSANADYEFFVFQSADSDLLESGADLPAALSDADDQDWTAGRFHDDDEAVSEVEWAANRGRFNLDATSPTWEGPMRDGTPLVDSITSSQRSNLLDKNIAVGLPQAEEQVVVAEGVTTSGRPIYEQFTEAWFVIRSHREMNRVRVQYQDRGEKIPLNRTGQQIVRGVVDKFIGIGEEAGHFDSIQHGEVRDDGEDSLIQFPDITDEDIAERRLRCNVKVWFEVDALRFTFNIFFQR